MARVQDRALTGADTAVDVITYLDQKGLTPNARFVVISLANSLAAEVTVDRNAGWRKTRHLGELFAPVRALLQTRDARGTMAVNRLQARIDAPLGWAVVGRDGGGAEFPVPSQVLPRFG